MKQIIDLIINLLKTIFEIPSKNPAQENWFNPGDDYAEREVIENDERDTVEETVTPPSFHSPVDMEIPYVTSPWAWRVLRGKKVWHSGADFRAYQGTGCYAVEDGLVVETVGLKAGAPCRFKWDKGKWIDLKNGSITPRIVLRGKHTGNLYMYKHAVANPSVKVGSIVPAGKKMGHHGNYGYSMGSHCHFEFWKPKRGGVKYSKQYRNDFRQCNPVTEMKKEFGMSFTGKV